MHRTLSRVARVGASSRPSRALGAALLASAGLAAATTTSAQAQALPDPPDTHLAARAFALTGPLDEPILTRFDVTDPTRTVDIPVLGVSEAETLVAIDVRPMNGMLYGLGIDDVADAGTLYVIDPVNGFAAPVGARGDVNYWVSSGPSAPPGPGGGGGGASATRVGLPAESADWDVDFDPETDELDIVAGSFHAGVDPNTGRPNDGINMNNSPRARASITGATSTVTASAFTHSRPITDQAVWHTIRPEITTGLGSPASLFTGDVDTGAQTSVGVLNQASTPIRVSGVVGFDVVSGLAGGPGGAYAILETPDGTRFASIDLATAAVTFVGQPFASTLAIRSLALERTPSTPGRPLDHAAIGVDSTGLKLLHFTTATAPNSAPFEIPLTGLAQGQSLVALSWRPQTGQLIGMVDGSAGMQAVAIAPLTGEVARRTFTSWDETPPLAQNQFALDANPSVNRFRFMASTGFNGRFEPGNEGLNAGGSAIDGNPALAGIQADTPTNPGIEATSYTNSFPQANGESQPQAATPGPTTQYSVDLETKKLFIQNPPNAGTLTNPVDLVSENSAGEPIAVDPWDGVMGLSIPREVRVATSGSGARGYGFLLAFRPNQTGGINSVYRVNLRSGRVTVLRNIDLPKMRSFVVAEAGALLPKPTITPTALTFAARAVNGASSEPEAAAIKNDGFGLLPVDAAITGPDAADFSFDRSQAGRCVDGGDLDPDRFCQIFVRFRPSAAGTRTATLTVTTSAGTREIALTGVGIAPGTTPGPVTPGTGTPTTPGTTTPGTTTPGTTPPSTTGTCGPQVRWVVLAIRNDRLRTSGFVTGALRGRPVTIEQRLGGRTRVLGTVDTDPVTGRFSTTFDRPNAAARAGAAYTVVSAGGPRSVTYRLARSVRVSDVTVQNGSTRMTVRSPRTRTATQLQIQRIGACGELVRVATVTADRDGSTDVTIPAGTPAGYVVRAVNGTRVASSLPAYPDAG